MRNVLIIITGILLFLLDLALFSAISAPEIVKIFAAKVIDYEFYKTIKWCVFLITLTLAILIFYIKEYKNYTWIPIVVAILYNPFYLPHLTRNIWISIDILIILLPALVFLERYFVKKYISFSHNPKKLVNLLTNFRKDTPVKWTTHIWDMDFKKDYGNFQGFINSVQKQWVEIEKDIKELSPNVHAKIFNFLLNKDLENSVWYSKDDVNIAIGWSSLDGLEEWCNNGNDPFKFKLKEQYKIENKTITTFGEIINLFKQEIQIRNENNVLENIFIDIEEKLDNEFDGIFTIETIKLKGKSFFTDIQQFKNALDRIFTEIKKRPSFGKIKIEISEDENDKYIDLRIIQIGSKANRSSRDILNMSNGGDSLVLKETLINLCDWSIESSNGNENYRINFLKSDDITPDIEALSYTPEGFTHIMRFYK